MSGTTSRAPPLWAAGGPQPISRADPEDIRVRTAREGPSSAVPVCRVVTYRGRVVELVPVTRDNWRRAAAISVADGQLRFVADHEPVALVILSKAFLRVADRDWWPYLIEDAGRAVGVVALVDERQPDGQLALFHLAIDAAQQRRGYGRAALRRAVELARQLTGCDRLRLTVHRENRVAIALYESEGFVVDGTDDDGELRLSTATPGGGS